MEKWKRIEDNKRGKQFQYQCRDCLEGQTVINAIIREPELRKGKTKGPRKNRITIVCNNGHRHRAGWLTHG